MLQSPSERTMFPATIPAQVPINYPGGTVMGEGTDAARTMKRRGLIAGAAALVAGIAAKQAAQPVRAVEVDGTNFVASGGSGTAFSNGTGAGYDFGGSFNGTNGGVSANRVGGDGVFGVSNAGPGFSAVVFGQGSHNFGVIGDAGA